MNLHHIPIASLPKELSFDEACEAVYRDELDWIEDKLRQRLSVLIECDKQLTLYLYKALRTRLKQRSHEHRLTCRLISGHAISRDAEQAPLGGGSNRMQRILQELQEAIFGGESEQIIVLPHLDVLTTTTRSGLNMETREAAALLFENPDVVFLGFKDPGFDLPMVIEKAFAVRRSLIGIPRQSLPQIILQREARKFGVENINPYRLYKYVSGLNAVRCRQILQHFQSRVDFDPATPELAEAIYHDIRQMTLLADFELPHIRLKDDIGGYNDVKEKIQTEILDLLQRKEQSDDPEAIRCIEEIIPKGMIFHGPPGTGKTFFAKAIATALDATILIVSGPELKSKWVGESEENLRRVFAQARKAAPSIIVFDELDSFASARGTYAGSGVEHSMVNQMLTEMDGFRKEEMVFVIGTTNFLESLDGALLRPGRFEFSIHIPYPNADDRKAILSLYNDKLALSLSDDILEYLVQKTAGFVDESRQTRFSGDHLYAVIRALKREQIRRGPTPMEVTQEDVNQAIGTRKKSSVQLKQEEERTVAVHEAGHAICAYTLPCCPTIEKVSIATGQEDVLGYVMQSVRENRYITTRRELLDDICVLMGGRVAEQMLMGDISVGSFDDLQRASAIARMMIEELGMDASLGLRTYSSTQQGVAELGAPRHPISEQTATRIDEAIANLLEEQHTRTQTLLQEYKPQLQQLVAHLLEHKTAGLPELKAIFDGKTFKQKANTDG